MSTHLDLDTLTNVLRKNSPRLFESQIFSEQI